MRRPWIYYLTHGHCNLTEQWLLGLLGGGAGVSLRSFPPSPDARGVKNDVAWEHTNNARTPVWAHATVSGHTHTNTSIFSPGRQATCINHKLPWRWMGRKPTLNRPQRQR